MENDPIRTRQEIDNIKNNKRKMPGMKKGISQSDAGANADELWCDTSDGNTVKLGV